MRNGDFSSFNIDGKLSDWELYGSTESVSFPVENKEQFLRFHFDWPVQATSLRQQIPLTGIAARALLVSMRMRAQSLVIGPDPTDRARVLLFFRNAANERVGSWPAIPSMTVDNDWQTYRTLLAIPKDAAILHIEAEARNIRGVVDIDALSVTPVVGETLSLPSDDTPFNGGFELVSHRWPVGWEIPTPTRTELVDKGDWGRFIRLTNDDFQRFLCVRRRVPIDPSWRSVEVTARSRVTGLQRGEKSWNTARLIWYFVDAFGKGMEPRPPVSQHECDSDWTTLRSRASVPPGAAGVEIQPALQFARGICDFDEITVNGQ